MTGLTKFLFWNQQFLETHNQKCGRNYISGRCVVTIGKGQVTHINKKKQENVIVKQSFLLNLHEICILQFKLKLKKMSTVLESLKLYFQNNSRNQIEKDWAESEKYDKIGPTIDEFIHQSQFIFEQDMKGSFWEFSCLNQIIENPKFTSDFFLN